MELRPVPAIVALFGATATGKTAVACALADRMPLHLISCDAFQVYRDLCAATAKPAGAELRHRWALVDDLEPTEEINLGRWVRAAEIEIERGWAAGCIPLVVGGSGLYLRGLLKGVAEAPARDPLLRQRLHALGERRTTGFLHRVLSRLDPVSARRIMPGDRQRLVRALEVRLLSGTALSELQGGAWSRPDRFDVLRIMLELPRAELYARIDARAEAFLQNGLVEEVRWLLEERALSPEANALRAIGYREVVAWLAARRAGGEPFDLAERIRRNTRRYARRQITWFTKEVPAHRFDPRDDRLIDKIQALIASWRGGEGSSGAA